VQRIVQRGRSRDVPVHASASWHISQRLCGICRPWSGSMKKRSHWQRLLSDRTSFREPRVLLSVTEVDLGISLDVTLHRVAHWRIVPSYRRQKLCKQAIQVSYDPVRGARGQVKCLINGYRTTGIRRNFPTNAAPFYGSGRPTQIKSAASFRRFTTV